MKSFINIVIAMTLWGSLGIFIKNINLPSIEIAFFRAFIAVILLLLSRPIYKSNAQTVSTKSRWLLVLSGIALGLNWVFLFNAYKYTTITNATISYYSAPILVIVFSVILGKETMTIQKIFSLVMASIGLVVIVSQTSSTQLGIYNHAQGILSALAAAILYASVILINNDIKSIPGFERTLIQLMVSTITLLPFVIYRSNIMSISLKSISLLVVVAFFHTYIPYLLYFSNIKKVKLHQAALLSYIDPVSAIIFGLLIFSEPLTLGHAIGGLFILGPVFINSRAIEVN
ncbi:MAG: DMT family transporter [Tissierellales bacterium]|jgi:drug/metabolite transporter (DMT)-like permease|nr:DMT family transporter [Tissierellales bacterium]